MAKNYVLLETVTVGAAGAASVTFNSIPQSGYSDLVVKVSARDTFSAVSVISQLRFNSNASGYSFRRLRGSGSAADSYSESGATDMNLYNTSVGASATASTFSNYEIYIPNYAGSNNKSFSVDSVTENNATEAYAVFFAGLWANTAAITSMNFVPTTLFAQYSTFSLYGIAAVGSTPTIAPKATGGDIIQTDGTYWYHAFRSSGTFTPALALSCDYLVVAGGGSGGFLAGGGGGAGGLRSTVTATGGGGSLESALNLTANTAYTVTIGAGGAGGTSSRSNGSNSVFSTITSTGGGAGGNRSTSDITGATGGSGGGGGSQTGSSPNSQVGGSGTANQGYAGGSGITNNNTYVSAGGGGGAGAVGSNASAGVTGNGGAGVAISAFASVTGTGVSNYYAGGGGGGYYASSLGTGGAGGGGNSDVNGVANTGGGGGGAVTSPGMNGGSGIVIVRYLVA